MIPANFTLSHYQFTIEAIETLRLTPFKGSALRGGFGHAFKRLACFHKPGCQGICQRQNDCPYGYIFETSPPQDSERLRSFSEIPRPFIIQSPPDYRQHIPAGDRLNFGLTLIGQGINYLPYFVLAFKELGKLGLGKGRGKYSLAEVNAISPIDRSQQLIYHQADDFIRAERICESANLRMGEWMNLQMSEWANSEYANGESANQQTTYSQIRKFANSQIHIDFLTPTRIKHKGNWLRQPPSFDVLVKTLLSRVSSLSYFHCQQPFEVDFRELIDRAGQVKLTQSDIYWQDWQRHSKRQEKRIKMGGLMGRVVYQGDLADYLPLLMLGQWLHVGKGTVFGNGRLRINERSNY